MGTHLNGAEALMWALDDDPVFQSSFMGITFLDRPPDLARFKVKMAEAVATNPIMMQRVLTAALDPGGPRWETDATFDLDYHVRHVALPPPGSRRQLLDLAALLYTDRFDRAKPLWQLTIVEGLHDGGAALLAKMHHVISDGIGAVRLSVSFLDLSPDGDPPPPRAAEEAPPLKPGGLRGWFDATAGAVAPLVGGASTLVGGASTLVGGATSLVRNPSAGLSTVRSLGRQLGMVDPARSPLWRDRTMVHRFDTLSIDLDRTRAAARKLGGTVNDVFVTILAGGAGAYHRSLGSPVEELRMSMPVSVRHDKEVGGNAWVPTRLLVPTGESTPEDRFAEISARLGAVKREPSLGLNETFAGVARRLPTPILVRLARQQVQTVDFACSNVRGAPFDLYIAGAEVLSNHPMGPTAGVAFNATVLSYKESLDLGLHTDAGAVSEPDVLRSCIEESAEDVLRLA